MENEKTGPSFGARVIAVVVLAIAAWILFKIVIGVAWFVVAIVAIVAVLWAVRTLF
jgi:hypothetical protein